MHSDANPFAGFNCLLDSEFCIRLFKFDLAKNMASKLGLNLGIWDRKSLLVITYFPIIPPITFSMQNIVMKLYKSVILSKKLTYFHMKETRKAIWEKI